jgi:uncharacterized protein
MRATLLLLLLVSAAALGANKVPPGVADTMFGAPPMLQDIPGIVSWNLLAQVDEVVKDRKLTPQFSDGVKALNNKAVKVRGYMMPLEAGEKHDRFLLSAYPPSCPFCLPAGASALIYVQAKTKIAISYEPVTVNGKMQVLDNDKEGMYYRMTEAVPAKE